VGSRVVGGGDWSGERRAVQRLTHLGNWKVLFEYWLRRMMQAMESGREHGLLEGLTERQWRSGRLQT